MKRNKGAISLKIRLELAKKASKTITEYLLSVDKVIQNVSMDELYKCYEVI